jgi:hypothetical protein
MKTVRIFLSVLALVGAVGGTFASQYRTASPFINGYEYVPGVTPEEDVCNLITDLQCDSTSPNLCTFNGHKVGDATTISTQCGTQLRRVNP